MSTVLVYRVELGFSYLDEDCKQMYYGCRQGPYTTYNTDMSKVNGYIGHHVPFQPKYQPEPEDDGLEHTFAVIYGFRDKRQLLDWFMDSVFELDRAGFMVSTYVVPAEDVNYGGKQLQFYPCECKLISMESLIDVVLEYL